MDTKAKIEDILKDIEILRESSEERIKKLQDGSMTVDEARESLRSSVNAFLDKRKNNR